MTEREGPAGEASRVDIAQALFQRRLQGRRGGEGEIPRRAGGEVPLSFAQEGLWFLHQLEPESPAYNHPLAVRLKGSLNRGALEQALGEVLRRHEALRTVFPTVDGRPVAAVQPPRPPTLRVVDLSTMPESEREAAALRRGTEEALCSFDLACGPLWRAGLFRTGQKCHILLLVFHHIIFDGWSAGVLLRELGALYGAALAGNPSPLCDLPIQYADYAAWQRRRLQGEALAGHLAYWKRQMAEPTPLLAWPTERPRPALQGWRGASLCMRLPANLVATLKELGRREGATPFMTLLAAFQVLLHRYSSEEDIVVGVPVAGRTHTETEGLIGCFINTLALRTDLSGDPTFCELLRRVRETALGAYEHQELPFERLVGELQPERSLSHTPLFQALFNFRNMPARDVEMPGLAVEVLPLETGTAVFDVDLEVAEEGGALECRLRYSTDLFDEPTVARMLGHYRTLLEGIVARPEARVSELPLLTEGERRQLLVEWNDTRANYPREACVHELFEAQAARTPEAVALVYEGQQMSYGELNARANQLARCLRKRGVGPEVLVGLCVERSPEMVVGVLGILKAGGAYLPLDPAYPRERLAFMLEDAGAPVLLTRERLCGRLPTGGAEVVRLDGDRPAIAEESAEGLAGVKAANLAYVIYTSGSTGVPKGVECTHGGLTNHALAVVQRYGLGSGDRVLQFASLSFDVAAEEIFPTWVAGGAVALRSCETVASVAGLLRQAARDGVTVLNLPTPYWHEWVQALDATDDLWPPSLRLVVIGSDRASPERCTVWQRKVGERVRLINAYGPAECTITALAYEVPAGLVLEEGKELPIGRPLENVEAYVLDGRLRPVPVGVPGELHIGGVGVARGYRGQPALTAERFIREPFSDDPEARLYKTGDLVRYLPDGNLEFLGRLDHQVKIRGYRIEPGEVEAALVRHPAVREAAVVAREDRPGDRRLVAYVVASEDQAVGPAKWREFLRSTLPDYMMPAFFMRLEALPLASNGKVDRRALPAPDWTDASPGEAIVAPRTPVEVGLAEIWASVLGLEQVGIEDDFFAIGGHSLLATQVIARVRAAFQVELPLRNLFEQPTIAGLAVTIVQALIVQME